MAESEQLLSNTFGGSSKRQWKSGVQHVEKIQDGLTKKTARMQSWRKLQLTYGMTAIQWFVQFLSSLCNTHECGSVPSDTTGTGQEADDYS